MDSADSDPVSHALAIQEETLQRYYHMLHLIISQLGATTQQLADLKGMLEATASQACPNPPLPPPSLSLLSQP